MNRAGAAKSLARELDRKNSNAPLKFIFLIEGEGVLGAGLAEYTK